jgi:hypothetical protein
VKRNEIRTKIRYNIRESTAEIWAEAELNYWINDVQKEVAALLNPIYNPDLIQIHSVSFASGSTAFDLPATFLKLLGNADLASTTYVEIPISVVRPNIIDDYSYNSSKPVCYLKNNKLNLWPVPADTHIDKLVSFPYLAEPTDFSDDTTTDGNLSDVAYNLLVDKVSAMALMKLDSEEALTLSKQFFGKYEKDLQRLNGGVK